LKAQNSIEKADYYFGDGMKEYSSIFQDRSTVERNFYKTFNKLVKDKIPNLDLTELSPDKAFSLSSAQSQTMSEAKVQFESAVIAAGRSANDALSSINQTQHLKKQFDPNNVQESKKLNEIFTDSTIVDDGNVITNHHLDQNDSIDSKKTEWKKNPLKSKRIQDRLFYSLNFQADPHTAFFPSSGAINGQIGFQLTKDLNLSLGGSYIVAFNAKRISTRELKHPISSNGFSMRSSLDHRLMGTVFINGNFELSQRTSISELQRNRTTNQFERAMLLGLKIRTSKGSTKRVTTELLYDFLHAETGQPAIIFRFGIDFLPKHAFKK
jgi:hypothetical protein